VLKRKYPGFLEQVVEDETSASFYEIENVEKQFVRKDLPDRYRVTPRADISIPRPRGSVCRHKNLTSHGLLADIAADFALLRLRLAQ
jgi:hypothetical protein